MFAHFAGPAVRLRLAVSHTSLHFRTGTARRLPSAPNRSLLRGTALIELLPTERPSSRDKKQNDAVVVRSPHARKRQQRYGAARSDIISQVGAGGAAQRRVVGARGEAKGAKVDALTLWCEQSNETDSTRTNTALVQSHTHLAILASARRSGSSATGGASSNGSNGSRRVCNRRGLWRRQSVLIASLVVLLASTTLAAALRTESERAPLSLWPQTTAWRAKPRNNEQRTLRRPLLSEPDEASE